jgi:sugar phosphate isomerase/epimerase
MKNMKLSIQHTLLPEDDLSESFQRAADYGFDGIELTRWGFSSPMYDHQAKIEKAMQASGLPVSSICATWEGNIVHPDPAERELRLAGLVRTLQFADSIGARGVILVPIWPPEHLPDLSPVADENMLITQLLVAMLKDVVERTKGGQAAVFLEPLNRYETYYLNTVSKAAELCKEVGDPHIKLMADLFHMNIEEADIPASIRTVEDYLGHCHLADSNRLLPGHGHTDFVSSFRALREIEFEGWLALECSVTGDPSKSLPACVEFLRRCWERAAPDETDN